MSTDLAVRITGLAAAIGKHLDKDERTAKAAAKANPDGEEWYADPDPEVWGVGGGTPVLRADGNGLAMAIGSYVADHIARHDPARVLRNVKATREFVAFAFKNAETIDGEWACCHDADQIAAGECNSDGARAALRVLEPIASQWDGDETPG